MVARTPLIRASLPRYLFGNMGRGGGSYRPIYSDSAPTSNNQLNMAATAESSTQPATRGDVTSINQMDKVDSWRSYRKDTTNLQALASPHTQSDFDPTAPPFTPAVNATRSGKTHFTPYQPLRISNGQQERNIVKQKGPQITNSQFNFEDTPHINRYIGRSQQTRLITSSNPDDPIPSVEALQSSSSTVPWRAPTVQAIRRLSKEPRSRSSRTPTPPPAPQPTKAYLKQAKGNSLALPAPRKLLVVLDLNGTLLYRKNRANPTNFQQRPGVGNFLDYLFANHIVMVYTSSRPENAVGMVNKLIHPTQRQTLAAVWARDKLDLTKAQYNGKVQVYKKLEKIWADKTIQQTAVDGKPWDQSNTILVDDSHLKALAQPHNLLQVPEFINDKPRDQTNPMALASWQLSQQQILIELQEKLEKLKWQSDVSMLICQWQNKEKPIPTAPGKDLVVDESVDQHEHIKQRSHHINEEEPQQQQLLTPKSPVAKETIIIDESDEYDPETDAGVTLPGRSKSVSPIDESVWAEILGGGGSDGGKEHKSNDSRPPRTPDSIER